MESSAGFLFYEGLVVNLRQYVGKLCEHRTEKRVVQKYASLPRFDRGR